MYNKNRRVGRSIHAARGLPVRCNFRVSNPALGNVFSGLVAWRSAWGGMHARTACGTCHFARYSDSLLYLLRFIRIGAAFHFPRLITDEMDAELVT